jgi:hypothetical protein
MPGSEAHGRPAEWRQDGELLHCLGCRRAVAAEAVIDDDAVANTIAGRAKARAAALVEFEIRRTPDLANSKIARACRTSVPAVAKARERIGVHPAPTP